MLGSEPHCPQSGFQESLIPSCEVFKHGFHRGGVDFFWNTVSHIDNNLNCGIFFSYH